MKKEYEIIITSPNSSELKRLKIKGWVVKLVLYSLTLLFITIGVGVVFYGRVYLTALEVKRLKKENRRLKAQNMRIVELENKIEKLEILRKKLYAMLGHEKAPKIESYTDVSSVESPIEEPSVGTSSGGEENVYAYSPGMAELLIYTLKKDSITPNGKPVEGIITRGYGPIHKAVDIGAPIGSPVRATAFGVVDSVYNDIRLGKVVVIRHGHEYKTLYGHLDNIRVYPGKKVSRGEVIGEVGLTGYTTGPHLHYEVHNREGSLNPFYFLND